VRLLSLLLITHSLYGYSVLSHEAIIDSVYPNRLAPMIRKRFPGTSEQAIQDARAYAYGGCIIQDMGYYPFGSKWFSDLVHYVHSGDFVETLLKEAKDPNEYAFALGALAHYIADSYGHPLATNRAVPLLYPKEAHKHGSLMAYEDFPTGHIQTEFGFDVLQVANGLYASDQYHAFVGFQVAKPVLERAFLKTYGIELKDVFKSVDLALGTYRNTVSKLVPEMTKVALATREKQLKEVNPKFDRKTFRYLYSQRQYDKEYGRDYYHPGIRARILAWLLRIVPKVGPFKALAFRQPTPEVDKLFLDSLKVTVGKYEEALDSVARGRLDFPNRNLDTGLPFKPGEYRMADEALRKLEQKTQAPKAPVSASR
jgi:hypothetical protein